MKSSLIGKFNILAGVIFIIMGIYLLSTNLSNGSLQPNLSIVIAFLFVGIALILLSIFYKK
ncbi:hypothetical protein [Guptibacillus hwajinpoensis]|uniref:Uncharacterized membrane protein HdeD (DUF308 family) n=1 Tax=Guptibacillus hwajinpoensis TaxID=208199 RepID=A0ABU0K3H3_9BACL|nr:hypothetical protein [Alkalihalobacillus hemicentroti]MDQ0483915.1 uncharacterized membrane protein HdeD (DUF308 family) [Alkalihalobacillus hemicentroti]